jgi:hypothetical protein
VRVDLALAAHSLRAAVLEFQRAEDAEHKAGEAMLNAFMAAGKTEAAVKIDGDYYLFRTESGKKVLFRKIEVL